MTRRPVALMAIAFLALVIGSDLMRVQPNPYMAPAAFALWSGQAQSGGFCGALPS
ncbi:MAG: hypothetical protein ACK5IP_01570 [Paracoccus sp. (in: a-proteobacteria)]